MAKILVSLSSKSSKIVDSIKKGTLITAYTGAVDLYPNRAPSKFAPGKRFTITVQSVKLDDDGLVKSIVADFADSANGPYRYKRADIVSYLSNPIPDKDTLKQPMAWRIEKKKK